MDCVGTTPLSKISSMMATSCADDYTPIALMPESQKRENGDVVEGTTTP
jgi:hypothetical protein